jgi:glycolate oxidase
MKNSDEPSTVAMHALCGQAATPSTSEALKHACATSTTWLATPPPGSRGTYLKFSRRSQDWAIVAVAAQVRVTGHEVTSVAIGLTGMGSRPLRASGVEQALRGKAGHDDELRKAAERAAEGSDPPQDLNGSPDYRRHLAQVLTGIARMEATHGLRCANVFHAGDGNLHPLILFDANQPGEFERAEAFGADILALCIEVGGTITGEHGVGVEKINSMCLQFSRAELDMFFSVKRAFDPAFLLNPDKAIPTLNRCAEFGKMRVSGGVLPFANLPRF